MTVLAHYRLTATASAVYFLLTALLLFVHTPANRTAPAAAILASLALSFPLALRSSASSWRAVGPSLRRSTAASDRDISSRAQLAVTIRDAIRALVSGIYAALAVVVGTAVPRGHTSGILLWLVSLFYLVRALQTVILSRRIRSFERDRGIVYYYLPTEGKLGFLIPRKVAVSRRRDALA